MPTAADTIFSLLSCWLAPRHPASAQEVPLDAGAVRAAVLAETNAYRASKNIPQLKENAALEACALLQQRRHRRAFDVEGRSIQTGMCDLRGQGMGRTSKAAVEQGLANQRPDLVAGAQLFLAQKPEQGVEDFLSACADAGNDLGVLLRPASLLPVIPAL